MSFAVFLGAIALPASVSAATLYWVGDEGAMTNVASNWKTTNPASCGGGDAVSAPGAADTLIFDPDCDNGATVPAALTVTAVNFNAGYTGTLTLNGPLTMTTFTQAGGSLVLNGQTLTLNGAITVTGGTFTAGTGSVILGGGAVTIDVSSEIIFYNLTVSATAGTTKTIAASDKLIVQNTLTLTDGLVSQTTVSASGTIIARGNIVQASTFDGGTSLIVLAGTGDQLFTGNATRTAGLLPRIQINKPTGTLTLSGTIRVTSATTTGWVYTQGEIDASTQNSTVIFAADGSLTITGSHSLHNVIFDTNSATSRTHTIDTATTLTVSGSLTIDNSSTGIITLNTGTIEAKGDIYNRDAINHTGTATLRISGTGDQVFAGNATAILGGLPIIDINKSSGTLTLSGTLRTAKDWTYTTGTIDAGTSTVVFAATQTITGSHSLYNVTLTGASAVHNVSSGTTIVVGGALILSDGFLSTGTLRSTGTFSHASVFDGGDGVVSIEGGGVQTLQIMSGTMLPGITLNASQTTIDGPSSGTGVIGGHFRLLDGTFLGGNGVLVVRGAFTYEGGSFSAGSGTLVLNHATNHTLPPTVHNLIVQNGLVGYWAFDDAGSDMADQSGYGNNGESTETERVSGAFGNPTTNPYALRFNGTNSVVQIPHDSKYRSYPLTLTAWFKTETNSNATILNMYPVGAGNGYHIYVIGGRICAWYFAPGASSYEGSCSSSPYQVADGEWHHLAYVIDSTGGRIFIDGSLKRSRAWSGTPTATTQTTDFRIGAYPFSNGTLTDLFTGDIDDVHIYSRALITPELEDLAAGDSGLVFTLDDDVVITGNLTVRGATLDYIGHELTVQGETFLELGGALRDTPPATSVASSAAAATTTPSAGGGHRGSPEAMAQKIAAAREKIIAESGLTSSLSQEPDSHKAASSLSSLFAFSDVPPTAWFSSYIQKLANAGIVQGYSHPDGTPAGVFGPADAITYAQIITMALRANGVQISSDALPHNRSARGTWAEAAVSIAESKATPVLTPALDVHALAKRGEVAAILLHLLEFQGGSSVGTAYSDLPEGHSYREAILRASALGILKGDTATDGTPLGTVRPDDFINRAEAAKLVSMLVELLK